MAMFRYDSRFYNCMLIFQLQLIFLIAIDLSIVYVLYIS